MTSVGVVVPAYRPDVEALTAYVRAINAELEPAAIRIELDAADGDVRRALEDLPATVHAVERRRGKGAAITEGFERLDTDVLAFADADGSTPAGALGDVVDAVVDGRASLAVGSRRHPDATIRSHQTFARRRLGDAFAWLARRLLDVELYDYQCGAKAITAEAWRAVRTHLREPGFAWDIELIAMTDALGFRVVEVAITWEDRPGSTVGPVSASLALGRALLVSRHRARLRQGDTLHAVIDRYHDRRPPLVERPAGEPKDD